MGDVWVSRLTDFLDERGSLASQLPSRARRLAEHFGAVVASASLQPVETVVETEVRCRRRPGRSPCPGRIVALVTGDGKVEWECPSCEDQGLISDWEGTLWDLRGDGVPQ